MKTTKSNASMLSVTIFVAILSGSSSRALSIGLQDLPPCSGLEPLVQQLRSPNRSRRHSAKKSILLLSDRSTKSHQCVVDAMVRITLAAPTEPEGGLVWAIKSPGGYAQWSEVTDILGTMKATYAVDALVDNIGFSDGRTSFGIGHYPAAKALVKFGEEVIPKLAEALRGRQPQTRALIAQVIFAIGGEKARVVLEEALEREADSYVAERIRNMLMRWKNKVEGRV